MKNRRPRVALEVNSKHILTEFDKYTTIFKVLDFAIVYGVSRIHGGKILHLLILSPADCIGLSWHYLPLVVLLFATFVGYDTGF